jgi:hypothetical protein
MFHDILDSTKSILFFGTPHQGADSATWSVYLSKISGVVGVQNTEVTAELMRWSNPLVELTKVFSENQEKISITTFYESRPMHGIIVGTIIRRITCAKLNVLGCSGRIGHDGVEGRKECQAKRNTRVYLQVQGRRRHLEDCAEPYECRGKQAWAVSVNPHNNWP